ncbi:Os04g0597534, partial [Oryza sativa Japonica Group]
LLWRVVLGEGDVNCEVHRGDGHDEQEEVIQVTVIQVQWKPPCIAPYRGHLRHQSHQLRVEQVPERYGEEVERRRRAPHRLRRLVVEELQLPDGERRVGGGHHEVLRQQPRDAHGGRPGPGRVQPARLGARGHAHRDDRRRVAEPHELQRRERHGAAEAPARRGHHGPVVERDEDGDERHLEGRQRRGRDGECAARDPAVRLGALLHERGLSLRVRDEVDRRREPYRDQPQQNLDLLHLGHRAQPPPVAVFQILVADNGSLLHENILDYYLNWLVCSNRSCTGCCNEFLTPSSSYSSVGSSGKVNLAL